MRLPVAKKKTLKHGKIVPRAFNTEAKLCFANTSKENAKKISEQAKQSEIRKRFKRHLEKLFCKAWEQHFLTSAS